MAVSGDRIQAVGDSAELLRQYPDAKRIIDCGQKLVFPGFINTHNHLFQTLLKGLGDDMSAKALLDENPHPDREEIRTAIAGNLCRCTGYEQIIDAIEDAAGGEESPWTPCR